jgi:hypothetical protein
MSTRTITVFSTKGKQKAKIDTDVKTWGELKPLVEAEGYDLSKLHATENVNRHDLNHKDGSLPEGNFTLFLRPKKTKSGLDVKGKSFKELRAMVKEHQDEEGFIEHLNKTGVNYTRLKTEDLAKRLKSWKPKAGKKTASAPKPEKAAAKEESANAIEATTNADRVGLIENLLEEILSNSSSEDVTARVEIIQDEVAGLKVEIQEEEDENSEEAQRRREEEEQRKADEAETEELANEADDFMDGFE